MGLKNIFKKKSKKVEAFYEIIKKLGEGLTADVFLAKRKSDGLVVVLKMVMKSRSRSEDWTRERTVLEQFAQQDMVKLIEIFEDKKRFIFVLERMSEGDLYNYIETNAVPKQSEAATIAKSVLTALTHLHAFNIAHRDLKLENILIHKDATGKTIAKLADFGFAAKNLGKGFSVQCGSLPYSAPELVRGKSNYNEAVDMWSFGVVLYIMLSGQPPFKAKGATLTQAIENGRWDFSSKVWLGISPAAKDLITRLLTVDATKRITAAEALQHPWIVSAGEKKEFLRVSAVQEIAASAA